MLGHIGARGSAYWNVRLLDRLFGFPRSAFTRVALTAASNLPRCLSGELGKPVMATDDWRACVEGADIVVEASRLSTPEPLLRTEWIKKGALVIPYGTMSAVELSLTDIMDKIGGRRLGANAEPASSGRFAPHVEAGKLTAATLHAELGQIVAGLRPGRERDDETILFWHRGLVAFGHSAWPRDDREGLPPGTWPTPSLLLSRSWCRQRFISMVRPYRSNVS